MKNSVEQLQQKSPGQLGKDANTLREEITRLRLAQISNPQKDTNVVQKKKKQLAQILTVMSQKHE